MGLTKPKPLDVDDFIQMILVDILDVKVVQLLYSLKYPDKMPFPEPGR